MFGNFIYLIVVLLIYSIYQAPVEPLFSPIKALAIFFCLTLGFALTVRLRFLRLLRRIPSTSHAAMDDQFTTAINRLSVLGIALFTIDIHGLGLSGLFGGISLFKVFPTLLALLFLLLFICHLAIIWSLAYGVYNRCYNNGLTRAQYVFSNLFFSLPALLPWFTLSFVSDILMALPYEAPRNFLATTAGEITYFVLFLVTIAILAPVIIQKMWRCRPLAEGEVRSRIENLCRRSGIGYNNILEWPLFGGTMITAGVMGLVARFRYILVTPALLKHLSPDEIDAVIAHEIGHVKHRHLWYYLVCFLLFLVFLYAIFDPLFYLLFYSTPVFWLTDAFGFSEASVHATLSGVTIIGLFLIYFLFIFGYFMRNCERQADTHVFRLIGTANALISTFAKIAALSRQAEDKPNWHHFSIRQRLDYLRKCEGNRSWIQRHDRKLTRIIAVYFFILIVLSVAGFRLNSGETGEALQRHFSEKQVLWKIDSLPEEIDRYSILGDFYYSRKDYEKTIEAYKRSIAKAPGKPQSLNNLAWLYATCEEPGFRDPAAALTLARKAIALQEAPHILDTLAESYFINGNYEEAIATGTQALGLAEKNRDYYREQLEKFNRHTKGARTEATPAL